MNKALSKNIHTLLGITALAIGGLSGIISQAYAAVPGKYLSADMGEADLLAIASKYPVTFWTLLIALIILGIAYCIYHFSKKKEKTV